MHIHTVHIYTYYPSYIYAHIHIHSQILVHTHKYMQHSCMYNIITRDITCIMQCTNIHTHTCSTYIKHMCGCKHTHTHTHKYSCTHAHTHKMHIETHLKEGRYYQRWRNSLQTHDMPDHSSIHLDCMKTDNIL